jgi:hypothetical protein
MTDVLATLQKAGVTLEAAGGSLVARPKVALTDELRALIRANKGGLLAELRADDGIEVIRQFFGIEPPNVAPVLVRCTACISFVPDSIGDGFGIGRCAVDGEGARPRGRWGTRPALWARGERRCGDYRGD